MTTMAHRSVLFMVMFSYVIGGEGINQAIDPQLDTNFQSIDNEDVYGQTKVGQYKYPVIFEPMRNIRLSISSYQVTTFVDLNPFFAYFENYEKYLNSFLRDLADRSKMSYLARFHHSAARLGKVFPEDELDGVNCTAPAQCRRHSQTKWCQRLVFTFCMTKHQYYQITNATEHIQMTYTALKNKFLGMIDYLDETLRSVTVKKQKDRNRSKRSIFGKRPQEDEIRAITSVLDMLSELETYFSAGQNSMDRKEKDHIPFHLTVGTDRLQVENIYEDPNGVKVVHKREKRNPIVWAALGWGVYSNKRQIDKIKENIERLQTQNILQDRKIDELTRYMNLTMEKVREHDERIYSLEVQMVQLRNSLIELSYDFNYNTVVQHLLRNAQTAVNRLMVGLTAAQHNVDGILEYLRAMATHQCSPVIISPPILRKLLIKVQDRITPNPRLRLPYDSHTDIWQFYDVLRITPVVLN